MDVDAKRPGEGGQKLAKSCGRLLWMVPRVFIEHNRSEIKHIDAITLR